MNLEVWLDQDRVGTLTFDARGNRFAFDYLAEWSARSDAYPLSPGLPLINTEQPADVHSAIVRRFFENLLPEGQALDDAARNHQISKGNLVGLLIALGRETAGALRLCLPGKAGRDTTDRRLLTHEELSMRIRQRPSESFTVWDGKVRLSIAGFQDKLAVFRDDGRWYLVEGPDLASTHILKPDPVNPRLAGLTSNELFCMKLAAAIGLETAPVELHRLPEPVLCIARFDRFRHGPAVRRRHVIDGCQLLDLATSYKYERPYGDGVDVRDIRDGASLPRLFAAIKGSPQPAKAKLLLLRWLVFQILLGNTDAHAKNLSFFMTAAGPVQAPAYDMTCTALYQSHVSQTFAMAVGDAFDTSELSAYEWAQFCRATDTNPTLVAKEVQRSVQLIRKKLPAVRETAVSSGAVPEIIEKISQVIEEQCETQLKLAPQIRKMMTI